MRHRTAPPGAITRLTDEQQKELSKKVADANKRSREGRGGGQR